MVNKLNYNLFIDRDLNYDKQLEDKIKNITVEEINKAMAKHIDPKKMVFVKAGDFAKAIKESKP